MPKSKLWHIFPPLPSAADLELHGYPPVMRQILYNRGYATRAAAHQYLQALPLSDTAPLNMLGIATAVDRIEFAIRESEQIAVYGDYDADGVTATALLVQFLTRLGANARPYIPNRFDEGYGLNTDALTYLHEEGVRLVITVDCGIRSPFEVEHGNQLGLDTIISDHHHPGPDLPRAMAIINPKQAGDDYPEKNLAGVGLAFKLAEGLWQHLDRKNSSDLAILNHPEAYLDLVALGTITDLAPLTGENRSLVRTGLQSIQQPRRQGVAALVGVSGLTPINITATDISFILGPRLNAAGRLESALDSYQLLVTNDLHEAGLLAQKLENQNRDRQEITRKMQVRAEELAYAEDPDPLLLLAVDPEFNPGVVGLVASRLTELHYRPSIVAYQGEDFIRGSCRSIPEFHITDALDQCADLLTHHGGHASAAGFTIRKDLFPEFIARMRQVAYAELAALDLRQTLTADLVISLSDLKPEILDYQMWLQPTGYGNPQAAFVSQGLKILRSRAVGKDNAHLKFTVTDGHIIYDAIAFRQGEWQASLPTFVDLLYTFERNEFNGQTSLQLNVRDLKPAEG